MMLILAIFLNFLVAFAWYRVGYNAGKNVQNLSEPEALELLAQLTEKLK